MEAFYGDELDECGLHVDQDPVDEFLNSEDIERLLEIETELMSTESLTKRDSTNYEEAAHQEELLLVNENNDVTDLLLMGAEALEAQNWLGASTVISRLYGVLNVHESGEHNHAFSGLALIFTKGLHHKLDISDPSKLSFHDDEEESMVLSQGNTMTAFQILQELTPYVKFAHFTANQAILEATKDDQEVHIIDFDIMDGIQWPPLMNDLSLRQNASLKITATVTSGTNQQEANMAQQTGRRLEEFADSIKLTFTFSHFVMSKEEDFSIIMDQKGYVHSKVVANCISNQFYMPHKSSSQVCIFLNGIKKLVPKILVLVEEAFLSFSIKNTPTKSFVDIFCEALRHYTAIDESLVSSFVNEYKVGIRVVETQLLGVSIMRSLRQTCSWKAENEILKDLKQVRLSSGNVSQAKFLVGLFKGGYWVQNENSRLALCWKSKPLTVISIWAPITSFQE